MCNKLRANASGSHWPDAYLSLSSGRDPADHCSHPGAVPRVRYCLPVYGNGSRKNIANIQKVINFAARVISGRRYISQPWDIWAALGWLDAVYLFKYHTLALLQTIRLHNTLVSISYLIQTSCKARVRIACYDDDLRLPSVRTEAGMLQFLYR